MIPLDRRYDNLVYIRASMMIIMELPFECHENKTVLPSFWIPNNDIVNPNQVKYYVLIYYSAGFSRRFLRLSGKKINTSYKSTSTSSGSGWTWLWHGGHGWCDLPAKVSYIICPLSGPGFAYSWMSCSSLGCDQGNKPCKIHLM